MKSKIILLIATAAVLLGCASKPASDAERGESGSSDVKYAKGFDIVRYDGYTKLLIYSPWNEGVVQQRIYLVSDQTIETPTDGRRVVVPVRSVAISSCTHTEPLQLIGEIESVSAVCTPELIYNARLSERRDSGSLISLGDAFNVNLEKLLMVHPDIFLVASYNQQDENANRLFQAGVPVVYNNEWTEKSLLARAEWIKFVAEFFCKTAVADSLFSVIERDFMAAVELSEIVGKRPMVMAGSNFKGTWYVPGGRSYMGQLFADVGADYFYAADTTTTSLPLNFETALHIFADADVWLNAPTKSLNELITMDERHSLFRAARIGEVYSFMARTTPAGANDFWESAVYRPDLLLKDLIWALHPELIPDYAPTYIMKLK